MSKITTYVIRGKQPESRHEAKCIIKDLQKNIIFSTKHNNDLIFPRSAIKIFQAIPFASSGAINKFHLNSKRKKWNHNDIIKFQNFLFERKFLSYQHPPKIFEISFDTFGCSMNLSTHHKL